MKNERGTGLWSRLNDRLQFRGARAGNMKGNFQPARFTSIRDLLSTASNVMARSIARACCY
jgi:hypothetical protein